jgi:hypothetical protein
MSVDIIKTDPETCSENDDESPGTSFRATVMNFKTS